MEIPQPESDQLILDSARRLTGPSLVWNETGAIIDVLIGHFDPNQVLKNWHRYLSDVAGAVGWQELHHTHRQFENGFSLLVAAPIDQLYSAVQLLETAWHFCACEMLQTPAHDPQELYQSLRAQMEIESSPELLELESACNAHDVDFLVDDDWISIGHGYSSMSFSDSQLPAVDQINWNNISDIPVAMITGTNGKSTSVRLLDAIARHAGQVSGVTSTDFVKVGKDILDHGDYSGPGGARLLLRDKRLEVAFLEAARGGILRRGLPLRRARVALVTNVASDHLGQYGINTLSALTQTKLTIRKALTEDGILVVNADDTGLVEHLQTPDCRLCWFSLDLNNPVIQQQMAQSSACVFCDADDLVFFDGRQFNRICSVGEIPMTLNGAAQHNVSNALGVIGVARAMGYRFEQIRAGLTDFYSDTADNPGRLNQFVLDNQARVIVDFAHNAHSVAAVATTASRIPSNQKYVLMGSAGDRSDDDIKGIAREICKIYPDKIIITETPKYLRGRNIGEVSQIMRSICIEQGLDESRIEISDDPVSGVSSALAQIKAQDLGLFLVLSDREAIIDMLRTRSS
ncbi:MAG: Mur ligase family protein [Pseudomonadota bacterium]